ncbi:DUF5132 domain-containing protein [Crossiella sp. CA198]|uniref:DUF5132 domain-containing protein n=1 Tax=Crossiella sp. CA198 TaxID=3455607 RepID=UPI003F8D56F1
MDLAMPLPAIAPFLIGLVTAPLAAKVAKPLVRGVVRASVGLVMEVRKAAAKAAEGISDLTAEATVDLTEPEPVKPKARKQSPGTSVSPN